MQLQTLERRLELLRLEGNGLNRQEIVKELSAKFTCSKDTLWYDFRTKPNWQPLITEVKQALHTIVNRHEQLYRKASLAYIQAGENKEKMLAVNLMKNINAEAFDMLQSSGIIPKAPDKIEGSLTTTTKIIHLHMWRPGDEPAVKSNSQVPVSPIRETSSIP